MKTDKGNAIRRDSSRLVFLKVLLLGTILFKLLVPIDKELHSGLFKGI